MSWMPRTRLAVAPVAALVSLASLSSSTLASATVPAQIIRSYSASTEVIANPERGFYHYTETHLRGDGSGNAPLDALVLSRARVDDGVTLVFRYYYLEKYRAQDTISAEDLASITADFAAVRTAGVKVVVRFAYSDNSPADAPAARVLTHIRQLAPVLNAADDVLEAVQAGFVGQWGEWYYSDNFASDPGAPWQLTDADWSARRTVLLALLDATSPTIRVQVRYPAIKQRVFVDPTDARAARVGIHDDCFLADNTDAGTFVTPDDRTWLTQQSNILVGGETCAVNGNASQWPAASQQLEAFHWTYLNRSFNAAVLTSWGSEGIATAGRRLGYRVQLMKASLPKTARVNSRIRVSLSLVNVGYAAPLQSRPVRLILSRGGVDQVVALDADTRTWAPGKTIRLNAELTAPGTDGSYSLHLDLPDSSPGLQSQSAQLGGGSVNAAYAIRLANVGTWNPSTGRNSLRHTLVVTS